TQDGRVEMHYLGSLGTQNYPLAAMVTPGTELELRLHYDLELFEPEAVSRVLLDFRNVLRGFLSNPAGRLGEYARVIADEGRELLAGPAGPLEATRGECLHRLFAAQAERTPDAVALVGGDGPVTYAALRRRAGVLGGRLRDLGVGPATPVGVYLE